MNGSRRYEYVMDEAEIREVLRLYLEKEGYEIVEAAEGTEAVRLIREEKITRGTSLNRLPLSFTSLVNRWPSIWGISISVIISATSCSNS